MKKHHLLWALVALLVLGAVLCALIFAVSVASVFGHVQKGTTRGNIIFGATLFGIVALVLAWLARTVEHHARTGEGIRPALTKGLSVKAPTSGRRQAHHSRKAEVVIFAVVAIILAAASISGYDGWQRSKETQDHGISENAFVTQVISIWNSTRYGGYYTYNLAVHLSTPVHGHTTAVVHTNYQSPPASVDQTITVLVDPDDPGYAELPGAPAGSGWGAFVPLVVAVVFVLLLVLSARRRHRLKAAMPVPSADRSLAGHAARLP